MYKPAKWPTYANDALEDALSLLEDLERDLERIQLATVEGDKLLVVLAVSSGRTKVMKAHSTLIQGKAGVYRQMEKR